LPFENLLTGIVYALKYDYAGDPDVAIITEMMKEFSLAEVIAKITGLEIGSRAVALIVKEYEKDCKRSVTKVAGTTRLCRN
jgi:hypothetical protein